MDEISKRHRKMAFKKILYTLSKKITVEELEDSFEKIEPKKWGYSYRDMDSDYDMHISVRVEFTKVDKEKRIMEVLEAEKKGETTYLNLEKEFGEDF